MENIFYVSVFYSRNKTKQDLAERSFIERAQRMGYQAITFNGDDPNFSEYEHVSTSGPAKKIGSSVARDRAIERLKKENPKPFLARTENVNRISEVLKTLT